MSRYLEAGKLATEQDARFEEFVEKTPDSSYAECVWLFYGHTRESNVAHQIRQILTVAYEIQERPPE